MSAASAAAAPDTRHDNPVRIAVFLWCLIALGMIVQAAGAGIVPSVDDLMRLAEVRDLIGGQSWFDTAQHRMNAPYGLGMHWSRLIDAPIAGLILLFRLFTDARTAETWVFHVWPVLPLLPALLAAARIGARLAGRVGGLFALVLAASCVAASAPFRPGAIDHHNVQLALMLWFLACLVEFRETRWAAPTAAAIAAVSIAIGLETMPYILVGAGAVAVWWIVDPAPVAQGVRRFGLAFAGAAAMLLVGATAHAYALAAACDTYSGLYALLAVVAGSGLALIGAAPAFAATRARRIAAVAGLAVGLGALCAIIEPACLRGPLGGLDPRIVPLWLNRIAEVQSPFAFIKVAPGDFVAGYCYAILATLGAIAGAFLVARDRRRSAVLVGAFALAGLAITTYQIRGLSFGLLFAMPGLAAFAVCAVERLRLRESRAAVAMIAALILASDATYASVANLAKNAAPASSDYYRHQTAWQTACLTEAALAPLAALPQARVLAFTDQGPSVLVYTRHAVVAGNYHRNAAGILDNYAFFTGPPNASAAIVRRRGVAYVVTCIAAPDDAWYAKQGGPNALIAQLDKGAAIAWLTPLAVPADSKIRIYRVERERLP